MTTLEKMWFCTFDHVARHVSATTAAALRDEQQRLTREGLQMRIGPLPQSVLREKAAQEAREKNAELQRQRAERAAERDAAERAAAATALPPMAAPPPPPPPPPPPQGAPKKKKATLGAALAD